MRQIFTLLSLFVYLTVKAQDGMLNSNWQSDGKVVTPLSNSVEYTGQQKLIVIPSGTDKGKILQTFTYDSTTKDFGIARYKADGTLDENFGSHDGMALQGYNVVDIGGEDYATAAALQSDGKIIVSGYSTATDGVTQFAMIRLNEDGSVDNTFGSGGKVLTTFGTSADDRAFTIAIRSDSIILAGSSVNVFPVFQITFALVRYGPNGEQDMNFGGGGFVTTPIEGIAQINDIAMQTDTIVVAGFTTNSSNTDFVVARYLSNGNLDPNFGTGINNASPGAGFTVTDLGGSTDAAQSLVINNSGRIILGGNSNATGADNDFALVQYNSDGTVDLEFGNEGFVNTDFSGGEDIGNDLTLQPDQKILLLGTTTLNGIPGNESDLAIARYLVNGTPDNTGIRKFGPGTDGTKIIDFVSNDQGLSMAIDVDNGAIFTGGISGASLALASLMNNFIPLPVHLVTFAANKQEKAVILSWETASEEEVLRFELLRSMDGRSFKKIGEVAAAGNSASNRTYSFVDVQPGQPVNFYQLKVINAHGTIDLSRIVAVKFDVKGRLQIFPNPAHNTANLQVLQPAGKVHISLVDISGHVVRQSVLHSTGVSLSTSFDLSNLPSGTYFLRVNNETIKLMRD